MMDFHDKQELPVIPDPVLMQKALVALDGICYAVPGDPLSDLNHPLHEIFSRIYRISHMGHQLCRTCVNEKNLQILEDCFKSLEELNVLTEVDKKLQLDLLPKPSRYDFQWDGAKFHKFPDGHWGEIYRGIAIATRSHKEDKWAIEVNGGVLNNENMIEYEPMPSNRDDDFLARTRFSLNEAVERAQKFIMGLITREEWEKERTTGE